MAFTFIRYIVLLVPIIFFSGCGTISEKLDIAGIIDKTETLIFGNEDLDKEDKKIIENNSLSVDTGEIQENYPDISEVPLNRPEIPEIDKSFFEGENQEESQEINDILVSGNAEINDNIDDRSQTFDNDPNLQTNTSTPSVKAISNIAYRMRLKVRSLLAYSDPPTDIKSEKISQVQIEDKEINIAQDNKLAIIQFPNNSIIPDSSAEEVLREIYRLYRNSKLMLLGHASKLGGDTDAGKKINMEISFARAAKIKEMLIEKGFSEDNIKIEARGDLEPLQNGNLKNYGEAANRRVEIFFITE